MRCHDGDSARRVGGSRGERGLHVGWWSRARFVAAGGRSAAWWTEWIDGSGSDVVRHLRGVRVQGLGTACQLLRSGGHGSHLMPQLGEGVWLAMGARVWLTTRLKAGALPEKGA